MPEEEEGMYTCEECGEDFDALTDDNECPECGQEYVFPPVEEDDIEVMSPNGNDETYDTVEEAVNAEGGSIGEEDEGSEKTQDDLGDVIVPNDEIDDDSPECEHCGEPMDKAPEQIDADWLCHNDGCEGSFTEEELEEGEDDESDVSEDSKEENEADEEDDQENLIFGPDGINEDFEGDAGESS